MCLKIFNTVGVCHTLVCVHNVRLSVCVCAFLTGFLFRLALMSSINSQKSVLVYSNNDFCNSQIRSISEYWLIYTNHVILGTILL